MYRIGTASPKIIKASHPRNSLPPSSQHPPLPIPKPKTFSFSSKKISWKWRTGCMRGGTDCKRKNSGCRTIQGPVRDTNGNWGGRTLMRSSNIPGGLRGGFRNSIWRSCRNLLRNWIKLMAVRREHRFKDRYFLRNRINSRYNRYCKLR